MKQGHRQGDPVAWLINSMIVSASSSVFMPVAGVTPALRLGGGLSWMVPQLAFGFAAAVYNAWVLLVEILR